MESTLIPPNHLHTTSNSLDNTRMTRLHEAIRLSLLACLIHRLSASDADTALDADHMSQSGLEDPDPLVLTFRSLLVPLVPLVPRMGTMIALWVLQTRLGHVDPIAFDHKRWTICETNFGRCDPPYLRTSKPKLSAGFASGWGGHGKRPKSTLNRGHASGFLRRNVRQQIKKTHRESSKAERPQLQLLVRRKDRRAPRTEIPEVDF
ncbi:hypothetical protein FPQ18DRAFT_414094 [Pyronema domesticum]|nr:hypothetical protein FPQ18DRAFT_414094 [Pyronema domesticum]